MLSYFQLIFRTRSQALNPQWTVCPSISSFPFNSSIYWTWKTQRVLSLLSEDKQLCKAFLSNDSPCMNIYILPLFVFLQEVVTVLGSAKLAMTSCSFNIEHHAHKLWPETLHEEQTVSGWNQWYLNLTRQQMQKSPSQDEKNKQDVNAEPLWLYQQDFQQAPCTWN